MSQSYGAPPSYPAGEEPDENGASSLFGGNVWLIAAVAGAVIVFFALFNGDPPPPVGYVIQATDNLPAFTEITGLGDRFTAREVPIELAGELNNGGTDNYFVGSTPDEAFGELAKAVREDGFVELRIPIYAGQWLDRRMLDAQANLGIGLRGEGQPDERLRPDERLFSFTADQVNSSAGLLRVGDFVDVVAVSTAGGDTVASIVQEEVEIVYLAQSATAGGGGDGDVVDRDEIVTGDPLPEIYTIRVSVEDALRLSTVVTQSQLFLLYRDPTDDGSGDASTTAFNFFDQFCPNLYRSTEGLGAPVAELPQGCLVELAQRQEAAQLAGVSGVERPRSPLVDARLQGGAPAPADNPFNSPAPQDNPLADDGSTDDEQSNPLAGDPASDSEDSDA